MDFATLCYKALEKAKWYAPIDTGNLRYNAVRGEWRDENTFVIYVDENIAPYMLFTNEPWINRKGKNPNENWWQDTARDIAQIIADELGGELK